jgi:Ca2+/Na+ antiporter
MEYTAGLFLFYIILVAKYFDKMLSCDFQRFMETNILAKHAVAFITAFYVIVLTETDKEDGDKSMVDYFLTTLIIYGIFVLSTKAKAQFVFPMLLLLVLDQILKVYMEMREKKEKKANKKGEDSSELSTSTLETVRMLLGYGIGGFITVGFLSYYFRQRAEFGANFSTSKFILGTFKCKIPNAN